MRCPRVVTVAMVDQTHPGRAAVNLTAAMTPWSRWSTIVSYVLGLLFLVIGAGKLAGADMVSADFARWGYPVWFLHVTGLFELTGAVLLLFATTRFAGAAILAMVMIGAVFTHIVHGEWLSAIVPAVLLGVFSWIATQPRRVELRRYTAAGHRRHPVSGNTPAAPR